VRLDSSHVRWWARGGAARLARGARAVYERLDEQLPHGRQTREYEGFVLVYSRRNSLVERIEKSGSYEREIIAEISRTVAASPNRTLIDVGANIGLVSLAVLSAVPEATVFAFEPGPHQHRLFAETIRRNDLGERLRLSPFALSNASGRAAFAVHSTRHAAGDGLLDTGRSGRARRVDVQIETLDRWWEVSGCPPVDVIKLDTEGSELWILEGAERLLERCRPTLFLEIHEENLRPYPHTADDVHRHLGQLGYRVEAFGRADFVARPT
jgi:FkbM family methyltransferase